MSDFLSHICKLNKVNLNEYSFTLITLAGYSFQIIGDGGVNLNRIHLIDYDLIG